MKYSTTMALAAYNKNKYFFVESQLIRRTLQKVMFNHKMHYSYTNYIKIKCKTLKNWAYGWIIIPLK